MKKGIWFVLAVGLQFLLLGGMAVDQLRVISQGRRIMVPVMPVDPLSLFQGEYVRLGYEFARFEQDALDKVEGGEVSFKKGDRIWVVLGPDEKGLWRPVALSRTCPPAQEGKAAVRGEVRNYYSWSGRDWDEKLKKKVGPIRRHTTIVIHTGLESFFVPQGEAVKLERNVGEGETTAELAILPSGRSAVRKLFVKGVEVRF